MASSLGARGSSVLLRLFKESVPLTKGPINAVRMAPAAVAPKQFFSQSAVKFQKPVEERVEEEPAVPSMRSNPSMSSSEVKDVSNLARLEKCVNMVQLMGRIGSEPQLRGTEQHPVLLFSLATHTQYRDSDTGSMQQKTFWHRVAIFKNGLRETCFKYCHKGARVYITGEVQYSNVKDPETNYVRTVTSIVADDVVMLGGNSGPVAV
ncbi:putative Single-stranded DNA-binding protein, mitochondrial [Hypsibius exemplaris]|uniref:Single-stranded DNA-binding protein, mitochondrial n=1 Tax=Hypsibius exemplaris TaxID=2072580 RepID=A0A1W0WGN9_HYPEX|nr:putative Single-stranded DNA-binding protein, mitochondrial [Hypsibius exemplaris]